MKIPKKILFRGLGGAGQRHLRLMRDKFPEAEMFACRGVKNTPLLNADFSVNKNSSLEKLYNLKIFKSLDEAYRYEPDLVVISMPSSMLARESIRALQNNCDVISEKPGAINLRQGDEIVSAELKSKGMFLLSYQRQHHPIVCKARSFIDSSMVGNLMNIRISVSSNVPSWHPYEDYRSLYACRKDLGGGVILTEIHELYFLVSLVGLPKSVVAFKKEGTSFGIDVEHMAVAIFDYGTFLVNFDICFMQPKAERKIQINGDSGWIDLNLVEGHLEYLLKNGVRDTYISDISNDDMFISQLEMFFTDSRLVDNQNEYFLKTLHLADTIKKSSTTGRMQLIDQSLLPDFS